MRKGLSLRLIPAVAIVAGLIGLVWGWIGVNAALHDGGWIAYLLMLFGFGGVVLALALWRTWKSITAARASNQSP